MSFSRLLNLLNLKFWFHFSLLRFFAMILAFIATKSLLSVDFGSEIAIPRTIFSLFFIPIVPKLHNNELLPSSNTWLLVFVDVRSRITLWTIHSSVRGGFVWKFICRKSLGLMLKVAKSLHENFPYKVDFLPSPLLETFLEENFRNFSNVWSQKFD